MKIDTINELRNLYGFPKGRAKDKELKKLEKHSINFIEKSPFFILSTYNKNGKLDASPRGGSIGFIKVLNNNSIVFSDAKGNNRMDSLSNIIETKSVGTLFFIPGIDETLRVNGNAFITTEENYLELFSEEKNKPKSCIVINIEEVFLHCAKALMRSKLWDIDSMIDRNTFPTMGKMLKDQLGTLEEPETLEAMKNRYLKDL